MKKEFNISHRQRLFHLFATLAFEGETFNTIRLGVNADIWDLLGYQIESLQTMLLSHQKQQSNLIIMNNSSWKEDEKYEISKYEKLAQKIEFLHLLIGYKSHLNRVKDANFQKDFLNKELQTLLESKKTPEEKIQEIQEKLSSLNKIIENI